MNEIFPKFHYWTLQLSNGNIQLYWLPQNMKLSTVVHCSLGWLHCQLLRAEFILFRSPGTKFATKSSRCLEIIQLRSFDTFLSSELFSYTGFSQMNGWIMFYVPDWKLNFVFGKLLNKFCLRRNAEGIVDYVSIIRLILSSIVAAELWNSERKGISFLNNFHIRLFFKGRVICYVSKL